MPYPNRAAALVLAVTGLIASGGLRPAAAQTLTELPVEFRAFAVANDGPTVVGGIYSDPSSIDNFRSDGAARWTPGASVEVLIEPLEYVHENPYFTDVSSNGSRMLLNANDSLLEFMARYDAVTDTQDRHIGWGRPIVGLSGDGGTTATVNFEGIGDLWTTVKYADDTSERIPIPFPGYYEDPTGFGNGMQGYDISGDGTKIVGKTRLGDAFLFERSVGSTLIATGPHTAGVEISDNGEWVAISQGDFGDQDLLLYGSTESLETIGTGFEFLSVHGVTDDGATMALNAQPEGEAIQPFLWRDGVGLTPLAMFLEDQLGIDLTGWSLTKIRDMSSNGRYLVGSGQNPAGETRSWLVDLPEPSTALLLAGGLVFALRRRRGLRASFQRLG